MTKGKRPVVHTIDSIHETDPHAKVEVLITDFLEYIDVPAIVLNAGSTVLNNNTKTGPLPAHCGDPVRRSVNQC